MVLASRPFNSYIPSISERQIDPLSVGPSRGGVVGRNRRTNKDSEGRGRADESRHTSLRKYAFDANDAELTEVARDANNLHRVGTKSDPNRVSAHDSSR